MDLLMDLPYNQWSLRTTSNNHTTLLPASEVLSLPEPAPCLQLRRTVGVAHNEQAKNVDL